MKNLLFYIVISLFASTCTGNRNEKYVDSDGNENNRSSKLGIQGTKTEYRERDGGMNSGMVIKEDSTNINSKKK